MKTTPRIIKKDVQAIKSRCEQWLNYVSSIGNECAYSDRMIEEILVAAKKLEVDFNKQFEENSKKEE